MEIFMYGYCHIVAYAEHCAKGIGTKTQMSIFTHILKALPLFLHWEILATCAENFYFCSLYFYVLTAADALYQFPVNTQAGSGGNLLQ